jgi:hypothetical protein
VNQGQFKTWFAGALNREDVPASSSTIDVWIQTARRQIQQKHDYKFMEASCRVPFFNGATGTLAPSDIKRLESLQVVDSNNKLIFIPHYERSRAKFHQLTQLPSDQALVMDPRVIIVADTTVTDLGYPLVVNWYANKFWWFPAVSNQAVGKYLYGDYIKYLPFDVSSRGDDYEDALFDEGVDAVFNRVLIAASPWFRDQLQYQQLKELYQDAESRLATADVAKNDQYGRPSSMEPDY